MSCTPANVVHDHILSDPDAEGWVTFSAPSTSALLTYYAIAPEVVTFQNVATKPNQHLEILQIEFEETAATSGDLKKADLIVALYSGSAPSTPSSSAVNNLSATNLLGTYQIEDTDYKYEAATRWKATVRPNKFIRTGTSANSSSIYAVVLANQSVTYIAGLAFRMRLMTRVATAL